MSLCGIKAKNAECAVSRFVGMKFCNMTVNTKYYFMLIFIYKNLTVPSAATIRALDT
jgi:hypothetical protein